MKSYSEVREEYAKRKKSEEDKPLTPSEKAKWIEFWRKEKKVERSAPEIKKEKKLCLSCGERSPYKGFKICEDCYAKRRKNDEEKGNTRFIKSNHE